MNAFVGIDISAKTFDVAIRKNNKITHRKVYKQTPEGHQAFIKNIAKKSPELIVMEATGIYYLDLAVAIDDADLPISVINPKSYKQFADLKLSSCKTDAEDAALLAEFGQSIRPELWHAPSNEALALKDYSRYINRLTHRNTQAKNQLHALSSTASTPDFILDDIREEIINTESRLEQLRKRALLLIKENVVLQRQFDCITAAKGISDRTAICLIGELNVLPKDMKAKQVAKYAGLSVRTTQSGTSINKPGRLNKAGNTYLRGALYMAAISAGTHDENANAFKLALVGRGKKPMQAVCAIMRKYLMGVWATIQTDTPFDSSKLFSEIHKKACV